MWLIVNCLKKRETKGINSVFSYKSYKALYSYPFHSNQVFLRSSVFLDLLCLGADGFEQRALTFLNEFSSCDRSLTSSGRSLELQVSAAIKRSPHSLNITVYDLV